MFTCRDGKGGKLSSQASKMLYKPPGEVHIASGNSLFSSEIVLMFFSKLSAPTIAFLAF